MEPRSKIITLFIMHQGSGNHMINDLALTANARPFDAFMVDYFQELVLARRDPTTPSPLPYGRHLTANDNIQWLYDKYDFKPEGAPLSEETAQAFFGHAFEGPDTRDYFGKPLTGPDKERFVINHCAFFSRIVDHQLENGVVVPWTESDRDLALTLFRSCCEANGFELRLAGFIRHPVDIFLSLEGRAGGLQEQKNKTISSALDFVHDLQNSDGIPVIKYEQLCENNDAAIQTFFQTIGCTTEEIASLDLSILHTASVDKWMAYPRKQVEQLTEKFLPQIEKFGYKIPVFDTTRRFANKPKKVLNGWLAEKRNIDLICAGNYSANAAFTKHLRSIFGRIYFRLKLLSPTAQKNVDGFFVHINRASNITPLHTAFLNLVKDIFVGKNRSLQKIKPPVSRPIGKYSDKANNSPQ